MELTAVGGFPNKADAKAGMAYFSGTGPAGKTCGDCKHRGLWRRSRYGTDYRTSACVMFKKMMGGRPGPEVESEYRACKYFEQKPE